MTTWWDRLGQGLRSLAAISGVVSFAAFAWQTYRDVSVSRANLIQSWQESEIFGIVFECRHVGADMGPIKDELGVRIARLEPRLGPWLADFVPAWLWRFDRLRVEDVVTDESVRRALMSLTERGIVSLRQDFSYAVPMPGDAAPAGGARPDWLRPHCINFSGV
jgi:hypothetical protein